jgi:hypothetical protein
MVSRFFAFMIVLPSVLMAAKITLLLHWAEPFFSKYLIGLLCFVPKILSGKP